MLSGGSSIHLTRVGNAVIARFERKPMEPANTNPQMRPGAFADLVHLHRANGNTARFPLLGWATFGHFDYEEASRDARPSLFFNSLDQPIVLLIDDRGRTSSGPAGWLWAEEIISHSRCILIHPLRRTLVDFRDIAALARAIPGPVVVIETTPRHTDGWKESVRQIWKTGCGLRSVAYCRATGEPRWQVFAGRTEIGLDPDLP
jgi:hypothetical protein